MIINDLDGYYIVFDTKNWNTELDTLSNKSIFYLLILIIQLSCCKDTLFFWKMQEIIENVWEWGK